MTTSELGRVRDSSARGIVLIVSAGVFLTANDAVAKWLVPHYPVGQILFVHAMTVLFLLGVIVLARGLNRFRVGNWSLHLARGALFAVGSFAFVFALRFLPLAEVVAIAFAGPIFTTLLAKTVLKEPVGWHRLGAVLVGFVGVVVMFSPGRPSLHWAVCLPLLVALSDACRDILTRRMTRNESTVSILVTTSAVVALAASLTSVAGWRPIAPAHMGWFVASAAVFVTAHLLMVEAYRHTHASTIAPFRYVQLFWGIAAGYVFWREVPDRWVASGIVLIALSGVYIAIRETRSGRRPTVLRSPANPLP